MHIPNKTPGSQFTSTECNEIVDELQNIITSADVVPSSIDLSQLLVSSQKLATIASSCTTGGTADSIELSLKSGNTINSYIDGMVFGFIASNTSTGPVTVNVSQLGAVSLENLNGDMVSTGGLSAGEYYQIMYDSSSNPFKFVLISDSSASARYAILDHYPVGHESNVAWFEGLEDRDGNTVHWERPMLGTTGAMIVAASSETGELNATVSITPTGTLGTTDPMVAENLVKHSHQSKSGNGPGSAPLALQDGPNKDDVNRLDQEPAGEDNPIGIGLSGTKKLAINYWIRIT